MEKRNLSDIFTPMILGIFVLSLFTGIVAAKTPDEEQNENAYKQYQIQKANYDNTRKQFEEAKDLFEKAYRQLGDKKDNESNEELKEKARAYIINAINHTESQLQVMKKRMESNEIKGVIVSNAIGVIDGHMAELEQLKGNVTAAKTFQELKDAHKDLKNIVININMETRYFIGIVLNQRIDNFIFGANNVTTKVDAAIKKLKAEGKDTTKLEADAAEFSNRIEEAKDLEAKTDSLFQVHSGFGSNGSVTNETDARTFIKQANDLQRENIKKLKEAGKQLIEFVRDLKKLAQGNAGKSKKQQKIVIDGVATATLTAT